MSVDERKKMVLAMEFIARQINDEDEFMPWLSVGVADGDIEYGSTDINEVDEYYVRDDNFKDLMSLFLRRMCGAWESGGLYCGNVVSYDKKEWEEHIENLYKNV